MIDDAEKTRRLAELNALMSAREFCLSNTFQEERKKRDVNVTVMVLDDATREYYSLDFEIPKAEE